jgi:hypothetical protein
MWTTVLKLLVAVLLCWTSFTKAVRKGALPDDISVFSFHPPSIPSFVLPAKLFTLSVTSPHHAYTVNTQNNG